MAIEDKADRADRERNLIPGAAEGISKTSRPSFGSRPQYQAVGFTKCFLELLSCFINS